MLVILEISYLTASDLIFGDKTRGEMEKDLNPAPVPQYTHPVAQEHIDAVPGAVAGPHVDEGFEAEMMDVDGEVSKSF